MKNKSGTKEQPAHDLTQSQKHVQSFEAKNARLVHAHQQLNRELELLYQAGQAFNSTLDLDRVLATVLEKVRTLLGVSEASVWLIEPRTGELVCRQASSIRSDVVRGWRLPPGEGIIGWVVRYSESAIVPDMGADERHFKGVDRQTGLEMRSSLTVPLRIKQNVIGALQVSLDLQRQQGGAAAADPHAGHNH